MSAANQLPAAMTAAEFLAWNAPRRRSVELVDCVPRADQSIRREHLHAK
jgi:hypothetical protein